MPNSSELGAGDVKVLKEQYNDLRDDVLDPTTGHDHTGAAGHGKQISGPDAIVNRTRKFFVQAYATQDQYAKGARMRDGANTEGGWGHFHVPEDFASGMTITPVIIAEGTGNIWLSVCTASYGAGGQAWDTHTDAGAGTPGAIGVTNTHRNLVAAITPADVAKGDIFALECIREGDNGGDTLEATVYLEGWEVAYTGDS